MFLLTKQIEKYLGSSLLISKFSMILNESLKIIWRTFFLYFCCNLTNFKRQTFTLHFIQHDIKVPSFLKVALRSSTLNVYFRRQVAQGRFFGHNLISITLNLFSFHISFGLLDFWGFWIHDRTQNRFQIDLW